MSKFRVVIYAQALVFEKTGMMIQEQAQINGLIIPRTVEHENEYECAQVATAFNGNAISETDLAERLRQLTVAVRKSMIDKGLVR